MTPKTLLSEPDVAAAEIDDENDIPAAAVETPKKSGEDLLLKKAVEMVSAK